jgi:hypothetical protein
VLVNRDEFGLVAGQQRLRLVVVLLRLHLERFDFNIKYVKESTRFRRELASLSINNLLLQYS